MADSAAGLPVVPGSGQALLLNVPYHTQFDGSPSANANCGPASLAMVLEAYDHPESISRLRELANQIQGSAGYADGVSLETLQAIALDHGLQTDGLVGADGQGYAKWTVELVAQQVQRGWPVVTLVHYKSLPGNAGVSSLSDHYVVIIGLGPTGFFVHDPAFSGSEGRFRQLSSDQLRRAWADTSVPNQAIAFGPGDGQLPLATALLRLDEVAGRTGSPAAIDPPAAQSVGPAVAPALPPPPPTGLGVITSPAASSAVRAKSAVSAAGQVGARPGARPVSAPVSTPIYDRWAHGDAARSVPVSEAPPVGPAGAVSAATSQGIAGPPIVLGASNEDSPNHLLAIPILIAAAVVVVLLIRRPRSRYTSW